MKVVYKITYPTGKIYVWKDSVGGFRYMGSPNLSLINADFANLPDALRLSYSLHKEILWQSETATEAELAAKEVEFIRLHGANDPGIGYNRWPKFKGKPPGKQRDKVEPKAITSGASPANYAACFVQPHRVDTIFGRNNRIASFQTCSEKGSGPISLLQPETPFETASRMSLFSPSHLLGG